MGEGCFLLHGPWYIQVLITAVAILVKVQFSQRSSVPWGLRQGQGFRPEGAGGGLGGPWPAALSSARKGRALGLGGGWTTSTVGTGLFGRELCPAGNPPSLWADSWAEDWAHKPTHTRARQGHWDMSPSLLRPGSGSYATDRD